MSEPREEVPQVGVLSGEVDQELDSGPRTQMSPEDALAKIRQGITIQNVCIDRLKLTGEFTVPVRLRNVHLVRPEFKNCVFREEVVFGRCTLERPDFAGSNEFVQNLVLASSTLVHAHLRRLIVHGSFLANDIQCRSRLLVAQSKFHGPVKFWEAQFKGWVDFKNCEFAADVDYRSLHAEQGFVLTRCKYTGDVLFRGATVAKKFEAANTQFDGLLDFSRAKLHDFVYLENVVQGPGMRWAFENTIGERLQVRPEQLAGRLASEEKGHYHQAMTEYAFFKRAFSALHRFEQEDWAFYRFKVNQRRSARRSWLRPWSKLGQFCDWTLLDHGCGYGTNPLRAVRAALVILLGFALIYMLGYDKFDHAKVPFADQAPGSWPNRVVFSLVTSVAVFTSGLSGLREFARDWMNVPLMAEALLGTLLWGLFIVAFSRKVIR